MRDDGSLRRRLLRLPLFYKILIANLAIVGLGAFAGTVITVWHVRAFPGDPHYELIALFALAGLVISFLVNNWVLKRALDPLDRLQDAVDEVRRGAPAVRVALGDVSDDRFDRLADTFNQMLAQLEQDALEMQQLTRRVIQAQEEERHRLAHELHDEAAQALTSLLVRLRLLERARTPDEAQQRVQELRELTAAALEDVRRVALDLRPTILDDLGLGPALEWRVDEFNKEGAARATIAVAGLEHRLPRETELALYRVGQEALTNVGRHACAAHVHVALERSDGYVALEVKDDGAGFDPERVRPGEGHGLGLLGMRERIVTVGGALQIDSAPGRGTAIRAQVPLRTGE
jgi:two-component system sensor histidine kinase UhpB